MVYDRQTGVKLTRVFGSGELNIAGMGKWKEYYSEKYDFRAYSPLALGLYTIIFKHVYWHRTQISGKSLQDYWSSG